MSDVRAAIYSRVSTEHQAEHGTSLDTQLDRCRQRANAEGWTVVEEFVERGVSGAEHSRPQLDQMLDLVDAGHVTVILTTALDRIGRSATHLVNLFEKLDAKGVRLVSLRESVDSTSPFGKMLRLILVGLAELEREMIRERMGHGRLAAAMNGTWVSGSLPWGLTTDDTGEIVVDQEALVTIERIVGLLVDDGLSPWKAAPLLNAEGHLTPRGSRWTPDGLRTLLRRITDTDRWGGVIRTKIDDELGLAPVEIEVPPVLPLERLDALRAALAAPAQARSRKPRMALYPLSGRVHMPCGGHLTGIWRRDRQTRTYRCSNYTSLPESPSCGCPTIDCNALEQRVWTLVRQHLEDDTIDSLANDYVKSIEQAEPVENSRTLAQRISNLEKAAGQQVAELAVAGIDAAIITAAVAQIESDIAATRRQYQKLRSIETARATQQSEQAQFIAARSTLLQRLDGADLSIADEIARLLDLRIDVASWRKCDDPECDNGRLRSNRRHNCPTCARRKVIPTLTIDLSFPDH